MEAINAASGSGGVAIVVRAVTIGWGGEAEGEGGGIELRRGRTGGHTEWEGLLSPGPTYHRVVCDVFTRTYSEPVCPPRHISAVYVPTGDVRAAMGGLLLAS